MNNIENIPLPKTGAALGSLSLALTNLESAIDSKIEKINLQLGVSSDALKKCEEEKLLLQEVSKKMIVNIGDIIKKIDKVLENDGSNNNNN